ncbi:MAG TPA: bestrophin family ion channel [Chryseolinea sp.]|nr:bestrophin family ion channel [Chryseolinea sp.]
MHTGKRFTPSEFLRWTRRDLYWMLILAAVPTIFYALGFTFLALPWPPVAILGTSVAFIVGFKNNASYSRMWEARQIYGSIINDSRSFGYTLRDTLDAAHRPTVRRLFNHHFAWLTALRYQLRDPRAWENMQRPNNQEFLAGHYEIPERKSTLEDELKNYLSEGDLQYILSKKNRATQLVAMQSTELADLRRSGAINDFQWTQLQQGIVKFTDSQGRAERIKNFPYPRNFSSIATYLLFLFVMTVPFAMLKELDRLGDGTFVEGLTIWFNIPFSAMVTWAFHTLDTVGESSVNPFEGSANDVPITQISRTIEIDMLDMLNDPLPEPITPRNNIVM